MRVAIIGTGNIGTDLLVKVLRSPLLECAGFIGRRLDSPGMKKAQELGVPVSVKGIHAFDSPVFTSIVDLVFDATSAADHKIHAPILHALGKIAVDLTPSRVGGMVVPAVNGLAVLPFDNVNMVTCGGQASVPIAHALGRFFGTRLQYIEVVSSIAAKSAGPATRRNLDEYIHTTERALRVFAGVPRAKAILNLNPASPCVNMQTTMLAKVDGVMGIDALRASIADVVARMKKYVPGYELLVPPTLEGDRLVTMIKVTGLGDYLPSYAGNLDIINCAAIATAEAYARSRP